MKPNVTLRCAGFSLLETLVAIMVLSIALVMMMQLLSGGLKAGNLTGNYVQALNHAQNRMETVLLYDEFEEGVTEGEIDARFSWEVIIEHILPGEETTKNWNGFNLFDINITVMWYEAGVRKNVELNTLSLGKKSAGEG